MIFIKFPASKSSIIGNYYTQKAPIRDDRIQPHHVWKYESIKSGEEYSKWGLKLSNIC